MPASSTQSLLMELPATPRRKTDLRITTPRRGPLQSGCREFHEVLDEKLQDIRNWVVEEHCQRLKTLQTQNKSLRSLVASQSKLSSTFFHTGPRAKTSESLDEVGHDHDCGDFSPSGLGDAGERSSQFEIGYVSEGSGSSTQSPTDRWYKTVNKMLLPASRIRTLMSSAQTWEVSATWLSAKKRRTLHDDTKLVVYIFEALDSLNPRATIGSSMAAIVRRSAGGFMSRVSVSRYGGGSRQHGKTSASTVVSDGPIMPLSHDARYSNRYTAALVWFLILIRPIWNMFRLLLVVYDTIMTPVLVFLTDDLVFSKAMSWSSRIFWTLDLGLLLVFNYGNFAERVTCCRPAMRYLKGWFGFDFAIVLSDWLVLLSGRQNSPGAFLRVVRVVYIWKWIQHRRRVRKHHRDDHEQRNTVVYMLEVVFAFAIVIHVWACVWYGVGNATNDGWAQEPMLESSRVTHKYLISLGWAASQIHGASGSDSLVLNTVELVFSAVSIFIGFIMFLFFVGRAVNAETIRFRSQESVEMKICANFCNENRISPDLCARAVSFFRDTEKRVKFLKQIRNEEDFLSSLPKSLRMDMKGQILGRLCMNLEFFRALDAIKSRMIRKVCDHAIATVPSLTDEVIFVEGDMCASTYIVQSGTFYYKMGRNWKKQIASFAALFNASSEALAGAQDSDRTSIINDNFMKNVTGHESRQLSEGRPVSEAALWTNWMHAGSLFASSHATLVVLQTHAVADIILERKDTTSIACHYAARFVTQLNEVASKSDLFCYRVTTDRQWRQISHYGDLDRHFAFLSHFKAEAGTEAALVHRELTHMIRMKELHPANNLESPFFLDSSDLNDLKHLREHVEKSQNLILLLTPGVLSRPWCVLEICIAVQNHLCIIPVEVQRPGLPAFDYPQEKLYQQLRKGALLSKEGMDLLKEEGFDVSEVEAAIRRAFMHIALPFSPHKSHTVRQAELDDILARCTFNGRVF